ncbi:DUF3800 domain-containing protein [Acinetobacter baumannii]|uniref:DUF3800 domain-containing protein n=2 Tax=Acinetobacter baumannii TaxID=470 RepID=UPI0029417311|nr:DUF3800 domain-containing protein [Acinetobacter baumannii]MDV4318506.1 DUF3800 domain-containing protein [Acinetobacter baumannii]
MEKRLVAADVCVGGLMKNYRIYCDESCHLEHDNHQVMVIGCIKLADDHNHELRQKFKEIQLKHKSPTELKWNTVSSSRFAMYKELIDAFFETGLISFRCVVVKNKNDLNHDEFNNGSHDNFYYKLVYQLLNNKWVMGQEYQYHVFLDIKDTRGRERLAKINQVFGNQYYNNSPFMSFQHLHSQDAFWIQWADFLIGAIGYKSRGEHLKERASPVKKEIINYLEQRSGYLLDEGTPPFESKFNIFNFRVKSRKLGGVGNA